MCSGVGLSNFDGNFGKLAEILSEKVLSGKVAPRVDDSSDMTRTLRAFLEMSARHIFTEGDYSPEVNLQHKYVYFDLYIYICIHIYIYKHYFYIRRVGVTSRI